MAIEVRKMSDEEVKRKSGYGTYHEERTAAYELNEQEGFVWENPPKRRYATCFHWKNKHGLTIRCRKIDGVVWVVALKEDSPAASGE